MVHLSCLVLHAFSVWLTPIMSLIGTAVPDASWLVLHAGPNSRDYAPPVATRMTDMSRTIAGGSLSPDQAPSSSTAGPIGASSTTPLSFGARTPGTSAQSPGPHTVPAISPQSGAFEVSYHIRFSPEDMVRPYIKAEYPAGMKLEGSNE